MQNKELNHCRLAMVAFAGMLLQEYLTGVPATVAGAQWLGGEGGGLLGLLLAPVALGKALAALPATLAQAAADAVDAAADAVQAVPDAVGGDVGVGGSIVVPPLETVPPPLPPAPPLPENISSPLS
jgi:hypothetical protein